MKYIKTFEKNKTKLYYLYPIENESDIKETYIYLYNRGTNPVIYKNTDMKYKYCSRLIRFDNNIEGIITNRSYLVDDSILSELEIDKEQEKEMRLFLDTKKYNL